MTGDLHGIKSIILCRLKKEEKCFLLRRMAGQPPITNGECNTLNIQQLAGEELVTIMSGAAKRAVEERLYFERRKRLVKFEIGRCYVSFDETGLPCHFQWIFDHEDNEKLAKHFNGEYPNIAPEENMLEHTLTLPSHRGKGIHDMALSSIIAMEERNHGIKQYSIFINPQNAPAMRAARKMGFVPIMIRKERWFFFTHRFDFKKYENEMDRSLDIVTERDSRARVIPGETRTRI